MLENLQAVVKFRLLLVLLVVHIGLVAGIVALARESLPNGWDATSILFLIAICALYGGFVLAVLFVVLPILPWIRRVQRVEHWTERLIRDLPVLVEHLPKLLIVIQSFVAVWNEVRTTEVRTTKAESPPS